MLRMLFVFAICYFSAVAAVDANGSTTDAKDD